MDSRDRHIAYLKASRLFKDKIIRLHAGGASQADLSRKFSVSRQRINQIVRDNAHKARDTLAYAKVMGKLPRADTMLCVDCGKQADRYDHRDYRRPLDVEPVCLKCNAARGEGMNPYTERAKKIVKRVKAKANGTTAVPKVRP